MIRATNAHYGAGRGVIPASYFNLDLKIVLSGSKLVYTDHATVENVVFEYF